MSLPATCSICHIGQSPRVKASRSGYVGAPNAKAIVLHSITNISASAYEDLLSTPLPPFENSIYPGSVHFIVTNTSSIQLAELGDTTYGLDYFDNPTWPGLAALLPVTDVNGPFIHIGLFGEQLSNPLVRLLCCIALDLGINLPIIASSDLQADRPELIIDPTLAAEVSVCVDAGGIDPNPPNIYELEDRVIALEACCISNTAAIAVLDARVDLLEASDIAQNLRLDALEASVASLEATVAILPSLISTIQILQDAIINIQNTCCPEPPTSTCWQYQLLPGDEMVLTPMQGEWLNLPTKIEDTNPPIVLTGPLWRAILPECGTNWQIEATVRFRLTGWCIGKKAQLYIVACGNQYLIAEQTIASTGPQSITLNGNYLLPGTPQCNDVHLVVRSTDADPKVIEFANIRGCCI